MAKKAGVVTVSLLAGLVPSNMNTKPVQPALHHIDPDYRPIPIPPAVRPSPLPSQDLTAINVTYKKQTEMGPTAEIQPAKPAHKGPKAIGRLLAAHHGWVGPEWTCLDDLWMRESRWQVHVLNASSGAYGIPQALPGYKMASVGANWQNSARTQIRWGLGYIADRYGDPCGAWAHSNATGWY